jgi:hypothetical protein
MLFGKLTRAYFIQIALETILLPILIYWVVFKYLISKSLIILLINYFALFCSHDNTGIPGEVAYIDPVLGQDQN